MARPRRMGPTFLIWTHAVSSGHEAGPSLAGSAHSLLADDGIRTRDTWLGKPVLYQLSYVRDACTLAGRAVSPRSRRVTLMRITPGHFAPKRRYNNAGVERVWIRD